jgi:aerobic carbon-monoxide dehydrogenase small subunit
VTQTRVSVQFILNGKKTEIDILPEQSALQVIRDELGMKGTKEGCGIGECGACTIEVDGRAVNACLMFGVHLDGCRVMTVEGLAQDGRLHLIQETFLAGHAVQCGFCTPGLLMSTHAMLGENPDPDDQQIVQAISGNICRCTGYQQIFSSMRAACGQSGQSGQDQGPESQGSCRERC